MRTHPTGASEKFQCQKAISLSDWADSIAVLPHRSAAQSIDKPSCRDSLHSSRWFQWRFVFFPWFTHCRLTQPDSTLLDVRERGTNSPFPDPHQQFPLRNCWRKRQCLEFGGHVFNSKYNMNTEYLILYTIVYIYTMYVTCVSIYAVYRLFRRRLMATWKETQLFQIPC